MTIFIGQYLKILSTNKNYIGTERCSSWTVPENFRKIDAVPPHLFPILSLWFNIHSFDGDFQQPHTTHHLTKTKKPMRSQLTNRLNQWEESLQTLSTQIIKVYRQYWSCLENYFIIETFGVAPLFLPIFLHIFLSSELGFNGQTSFCVDKPSLIIK